MLRQRISKQTDTDHPTHNNNNSSSSNMSHTKHSNQGKFILQMVVSVSILCLMSFHMIEWIHGNSTQTQIETQTNANVKLKKNAGNLRSGIGTKHKAKNNQNLVKFPSPYPDHDEGGKYNILLQPQYGSHRPGENAVFAFAEGYDLRIYVLFVESLLATGYSGDIVLSVSHEDKLKKGVGEYLKKKAASNNVVVYTVDWECFKKNGEAVEDARGGMADCRVDHLFGYSTSEGGKPASDPR